MVRESRSPSTKRPPIRADGEWNAADLRDVLAELRGLRADIARLSQALVPSESASTERPEERPSGPVVAHLDQTAPPTDPTRSRPVLRVQCLGAFRAWLNDRPLELGRSRKGQSIFRFLIAHGGGPVQREALMELMWPGVPETQARHRLNMAVYSLRQGLQRAGKSGQGLVLFAEGAYLLDPSLTLDVDADRFLATFHRAEAALAAGAEAAALAEYELADRLYRGEYLSEERYSDWAQLTQQRLEDAHLTSLVKLGRLYVDRGDYGRAMKSLQAVLAADPCREDGHRMLMLCHAREGRRAQALRQFVECARILKAELGVEPSDETLRLAEQIRNAEPV